MAYILLTIALIVLDQVVKYLVSSSIPLYGSVPFIPYIMELTYVQNTGAAFSILSEHTWILTLISLVMSVILAVCVWKKFFSHPFGRTALTLILAGAIGNLIDRVWLGYVVDMIELEFMRFAVFNVADCAVCVGAALLVIYAFFFDEDSKKKKEKSHDSDG